MKTASLASRLFYPCVWTPPASSVHDIVAETRQIHMDYQVLWRKKDSTVTVSRGECLGVPGPLSQEKSALTLALTGFYCFSQHVTLRMILIYYAQVLFRQLQKTKERVLLITFKRKDICKCKGKSG